MAQLLEYRTVNLNNIATNTAKVTNMVKMAHNMLSEIKIIIKGTTKITYSV
jgi:hypothetical protein